MDFVSIVNISALVNKLLFFLANAVGLELILWAYAANRQTRLGLFFLFGVLFSLVWLDIDFIGTQAASFFGESTAAAALWATRSMFVLMGAFFAAFHVFCLNFPAANPLDGAQRRKNNIIIGAWSFLSVLALTPLVIAGVALNADFPVLVRVAAGPVYWVYLAAAVASLALSYRELSRNRALADPQNREKARFAVLAGGLFGGYNLIFNIIGPLLGELWSYCGFFVLFGNYAVLALLGYIVYLAARDKLFGIKIILVEIFVGLMGASLAAMPFFVELLWQQALLMVLFVLFCIFGYALVKSTIQEYREKELLEQKVAERTEELERAKNNLEETNSMLEDRVRLRTGELQKLNQTLEEKVVARTNDLEAKIRDLETFQRITVGRELKMIELKRQIEQLRGGSLAKNSK